MISKFRIDTRPIAICLTVLFTACGGEYSPNVESKPVNAAPLHAFGRGVEQVPVSASVSNDAPEGSLTQAQFQASARRDFQTISSSTRPFPQHVNYTAGLLHPTNVSQTVMDNAVLTHYSAWKTNYVKTLSGSNPIQKWIKYDSTNSTVSEAMGYGMVHAAYMADKTDFDAMYHYIKAHPSTIGKNLLAWKQTLKNGKMVDVEGADSATDGDMDTAYSLILADKQWGSSGAINYKAQALLILADLMTYCVNQSDSNLLAGDWASAGGSQPDLNHSRPSDYMVDHFLAFAAFDTTRSTKWMNVYNRVTTTVNYQFATGSANTGLMADFYVKSGSNFVPVSGTYLESKHDGDYSYNSARTPWRLPMAYILTGRTDIKASQVKMASWISAKTSNTPTKVRAGYYVKNGTNGSSYVNYDDLAFVAPFAVNAMMGSNQLWLNNLWTSITGGDYPTKVDYFGDAIRFQVLLVVSGNWWLPDGDTITPPTPPTTGADLNNTVKKEYAMEIVSSAENSSLNWRAQFAYIEDIKDGRGYTAGIIGFCSGTGDMLELVQAYTNNYPNNGLAKYLPALVNVNNTESHTGLDPNFTTAWAAEAKLAAFQAAQEKERDDVYFNPSVAKGKADGIRALGQFAYYDAAVVHGFDGMMSVRARAMAKVKTPAQGGSEVAYLNAFMDERVVEMKKEAAHSDVTRIETAQRVWLNAGNLDLNAPLSWSVYGDSFSIK